MIWHTRATPAPRIIRRPHSGDVSEAVAHRLIDHLVRLQAEQELVHLCLTGGRIANQTYQVFANLVPDSGLDPQRLHLWWGDERFLPTGDPDRNALQSLSILARTLQLRPSQTHPMPSREGQADPGDSAFDYAEELGDTRFDVCLLGMGPDGHVASIFPHHPSFEPTTSMAIGVVDAPKPPAERISLSLAAINRSQDVWLLVTGEEKAEAVGRVMSGEEELPASHVAGRRATVWFLDDEAASQLPRHHCSL